VTVPTVPTKATIPETGRARYFRYLLQRCVERPQLLVDGARAIASPHVAYLDMSGSVSRSVVIFSSQRSGSTLLAELLVSRKRQRLIFEPFWGSAVGVSRDITRGRFIDPESRDLALNHLLRMVLSGRVRNLWVDRENPSRLPRGRVIKDCWGINLAPYLARHFPEVPLILLLRHPVATAHSVMALGWGDELESILNQRGLIPDQFAAQAPLIECVLASERPSVPSLVLRWCLENAIPLNLLSRGSAHVVFYEDLTRSGPSELERLAVFLGERSPELWSGWIPDPSLLDLPSATDWRDRDRLPSQEERRQGWQDAVTAQDLERSMEILRAFRLDRLYGPGPDPLTTADEVLSRDAFPSEEG
jgi:hypothetical protein